MVKKEIINYCRKWKPNFWYQNVDVFSKIIDLKIKSTGRGSKNMSVQKKHEAFASNLFW